jgi:outer membrane protein
MTFSRRLTTGTSILAIAPMFVTAVPYARAQTATPPPSTGKPAAPTHRAAAHAAPSHPANTSAVMAVTAVPSGPAVPRTLMEALVATYQNDPQLLAERAKLRATDENVPAALAGWRPTVVISGSAGYATGLTITPEVASGSGHVTVNEDRNEASSQLTITQPIYRGGRTRATTNKAENQVMAERANLIAQEQTSFNNAITAYVGVIQAKDILLLDINNEQVLTKQLQATNDRFRVGEITRTDVAQAEAALAQATATRETAEGQLQTARATFERTIGYLPPDNLVPPQPLSVPVKTEVEAITLSVANNPNVVSALFNDAASKDSVDAAYSQLMPQINVQGQAFYNMNTLQRDYVAQGWQVLANLSVPLYQGGSEYAAIRQARQSQQQTRKLVDDARRAARQASIQAWETLVAARATISSTQAAVRANTIALEGVEREAIVGSRTTLDVLNAQEALLQSQTTLVQNLAALVTASYQLALAVGRLTARDLNLPVPLYDETAYYEAVRNRWAGTGDYATDQPGR